MGFRYYRVRAGVRIECSLQQGRDRKQKSNFNKIHFHVAPSATSLAVPLSALASTHGYRPAPYLKVTRQPYHTRPAAGKSFPFSPSDPPPRYNNTLFTTLLPFRRGFVCRARTEDKKFGVRFRN